jgi:hypothetical protein
MRVSTSFGSPGGNSSCSTRLATPVSTPRRTTGSISHAAVQTVTRDEQIAESVLRCWSQGERL